MAGQQRNNYKKTAASINSKWLSNTLKSMGVAGTEVIKELMPATSETMSTGSKMANEVARNIRSNRQSSTKIQNAIKQNPAVKMGQDFFRNALEDIKSGNFYNDKRVPENDQLSDMDTMFGDIDDYFGDDETTEVNVQNNIINSSEIGEATIKAVREQTEYQVRASKATVDTMVSVGSATILKVNEIGSKVLSELATINSNLAAMVEYNNTNMTKFIEASIGYYEQMSSQMESSSKSSDRVTADNIYGSGGGLDFRNYKEYVKGNIKKLKDDSMLGGMIGMILENKDQLVTNPLGGILTSVMKSAIPKVLQTSMKALDESVKDFIPTMLERIGSLGEGEYGPFASLSKTIAKVFGVKTSRKTEFDTSKIHKGPMPYNGIANHTIVEIIPKYLRESNTYLKEIAMAVTGKSGDSLAKGFTGFDWETGKFKSIEEIERNLFEQLSDTVVSAFERSKGGDVLSSYENILTSESDRKKFNDSKKHVYINMEKYGKEIDFSDPEAIQTILNGISMPANVKALYEEAFADMLKNRPDAIANLNATRSRAMRKRNQQMKFFEEEASTNGLNSIDNSDGAYDRYTAREATLSGTGHTTARASVSVPTLLQGIHDTLNRGIYVQFKKFDGSNLSSSGDGTIESMVDAVVESSTQTREDIKNAIAQREGEDSEINIPSSGSLRQRAGSHVAKGIYKFKGIIDGIMAGNADKAWDAFLDGMRNTFETAGKFLSEHFFNPIKKNLFGERDVDGYIKGGLFEGVNNRMKESFYSLRRMITGKGYTDASGNIIADANEEEMKNTVSGKLKSMLTDLKESIKVRLFGEKDEEGKETKEGVVGKFKNGLSNAASSLLQGLDGWKKALFGEKDEDGKDPEKSGKEILEGIKKKASDTLPSALAGSVVGGIGGAMSGGILGTLVGGPIGGALIGFAGGIASKSEKFQNWLFGEKDEEGNRAGGVISKKTQEYMKKNGKFLAGGAALGTISGAITGGGILGTLVGGPIAGALMGLGSSILVKSDTFQKFLFGDEKAGQVGIVTNVKRWISGFGKDIEGTADSKKLIGMMGIGTAAGGLLGSLVGGPIVGATLGLSASILTQKDNFHEWLFGKVDKETGVKKEGILGQFKNMLMANVIHPIGNDLKSIGADFKTFLKYDVLGRLNLIIEPIGDAVFGGIKRFTTNLTTVVGNFSNYIKENFLSGLVDATKTILTPVTDAARVVAKGVYTAGKAIVSAPIKLIYAITNPIAVAVSKTVKGVASAAFKGINTLLIKPINTLVLKPLGFLAKTALKIVSKPFEILGKTAEFINNKVVGFASHVGRFIKLGFSTLGHTIIDSVKNSKFVKGIKNVAANIKDTVIQVVSPITNLAKSAIHQVTESIKKSISNAVNRALHYLNPITWAKGLFNIGKKVVNGIRGVDDSGKDNSQESNANKKDNIFKRLWRQSAGEEIDHSDSLLYDDKGKIIGTTASLFRRRGFLEQDRKNARYRNKLVAEENKKRSKNEKLIAKYTNNQRFADTEENRLIAQAEARKHGKTLDFGDINALQTETEKKTIEFQDESLDTQRETRDYTREIADYIMGRRRSVSPSGNKSTYQRSNEAYTEGKQNGIDIFNRDAKVREARSNIENYGDKKDYNILKNARRDAREKENKKEVEEFNNIFENARQNGGGFFSGLLNSIARISGKYAGFKKARTDAKNEDLERHEHGTGYADAGLAIVGESGPEAVYANGSKYGRLVGLNGPEVVRMRGGETVIPNSRIARFEDGTDNQDTSFDHSSESDEDLISKNDYTSLTIGERIIRELIGIRLCLGGVKFGGRKINTPKINSSKLLGMKNNMPLLALPGVANGVTFDSEGNEVNENEEAQAAVSGLTGESEKARIAAIKEENEDDERQESMLAALLSLVKGQQSHNTIWNSIFSKKGLLTGLLISGLFLLINKFKNFNLGGFLDDLEEKFKFGLENLGDGKTVIDKLSDEVSGVSRVVSNLVHGNLIGAVDNFLYDEDGNVYNETGARAKLLTRTGARAASWLTGLGTKANTIIGGGIKAYTDDGARGVLRHLTSKETGRILTSRNVNLGSNRLIEIGRNGLSGIKTGWDRLIGKTATASADDLAENAIKATINATDDVVGKTASSLADETCEFFTKFIDDFFRFLQKKGFNITSKCATSLTDDVLRCVSTHFPKVAAKISAILGITAGVASTGVGAVGLLAKEGTWVVLSALNGATGAKRLFMTDTVDALMVLISTGMGAFAGTTVGSICDIINELVVSVLGFDAFSQLATLVYGILAGNERANALYAAQEDFRNNYIEVTDAELSKQYDTMISAGLLNPNVTREQYMAGARGGEYDAEIQSFADFNDEKHQTLGSRIWSGISTGAKSTWRWLAGEDTTYYTDRNGYTYTKNDNGTYQVTDNTGKDLGYVSKDAIPQNAEIIKGYNDGIFVDAWEANKRLFEYTINGDIEGFVKDKFEPTHSVPVLDQIMNGIYQVFKIIVGLPCLISAGGHALWDNVIKPVGTTIGRIPEVMKEEYSYAENLMKDSNSDYKDLLRFDTEKYGEMGYTLKNVAIASRISVIPISVMKKIGRTIGEKVEYITGDSKQNFSTFKQSVLNMSEATINGDFSGLWTTQMQLGSRDPLYHIWKNAGMALKVVQTPVAGIMWLGGKIGEGIDYITGDSSANFAIFKQSISDMSTASANGDFSGLWNTGMELGSRDPLYFLWKNIGMISKVVQSPVAGVMWVGNKIEEGIDYITENSEDNAKEFNSAMATISDYASKGDISGVWSTSLNLDDKDPLYHSWKVFSVISKLFNTIIGAFNMVAIPLLDSLESAKNAISDWWDDSYLKDAVDWTDDRINDVFHELGTEGGFGEKDSLNGHPYYSQKDSRWSNLRYRMSDGTDDGATIGNAGCGPTAMSMIVSDLKNREVTPVDMAKYAQLSGTRDETGTNWKFINKAANVYGIDSTMSTDPSLAFISSNLRNGNPMILSGQDDGSGSTPYTDAGHYIVAVGMDNNGNIIYNDPRGESYSGKANINSIIGNTGAAWSFSNKGTNDRGIIRSGIRKAARGISKFIKGGRGLDRAKWISIIRAVKQAIADTKCGYSNPKDPFYINLTVGGKTLSVRPDCSGFVAACMKYFGVLSDGDNLTASSLTSGTNSLNNSGFIKRPFTGWENLEEGDIVAKSTHTAIFGKLENGVPYVYNCGSTPSCNNPGLTRDSATNNYTTVWSPTSAGVNCITSTDISSTLGGILGSTTGFGGNILSGLSSGLSAIASTAFNAILTGNLNTNWDDVWRQVFSGDSSGDNLYLDGINLQGSNNAEKIWKYFKDRGYSEYGIAGLMGNLYAESGLRPDNLQDTSEARLGTDLEYTNRINTGSYSGDQFANDNAGYGLAQWTSTGRKLGLFNLHKSKGLRIDDIGLQLDWLINELTSGYSGVNNTLKNASSVKEASDAFLHGFERPTNQSSEVELYRARLGQGYYDLYNGKSLITDYHDMYDRYVSDSQNRMNRRGTGNQNLSYSRSSINPVTGETVTFPSLEEYSSNRLGYMLDLNNHLGITNDTRTTLQSPDDLATVIEGLQSVGLSDAQIDSYIRENYTVSPTTSLFDLSAPTQGHGAGVSHRTGITGGSGNGPTIQKRRYIGNTSYNNTNNDIQRAKYSTTTKSLYSTGNRYTINNNTSADNSTLEGLMTQVVSLLSIISKHSGNLDLLKDIRSGLNTGSTNIVNTTNVSNGKGTPMKQNKSATGGLSQNEITARRIAFGS